MTEPVSMTPEEVERAEYEIFQNSLHKAMVDGTPITLSTAGLNAQRIMAMRDLMVSERAAIRRQMVLDSPMLVTKPEITVACPICGTPSPEGKTCVACLDKYIAESEEWLKKNA